MDKQNKESLIHEYAKKIHGFAYGKAKNYHDAEDLSSEIIATLLGERIAFEGIENPDAYIYRICCYTWSNFIRRKNREALPGDEIFFTLSSGEDVESELIEREENKRLIEILRREIMYLNRIRREITVMYYYENKSGDEISKALGIPASTVRWHMRETKEILKERIEMKENNSIYQPVRLIVGHNGWVTDYDMNGLASDLIMQNICIICREKPLTIEEIARTLGIASAYLEDKINKLLYMDYIKQVGKNKYQTNFFINYPELMAEVKKFQYENVMRLVPLVYEGAVAYAKAIRENGLIACGEFSENTLVAAMAMVVTNCFVEEIARVKRESLKLFWQRPKRKDGSEHFVGAVLPGEPPDWVKTDPEFSDFFENSNGCGVKTRVFRNSCETLQYDQNLFGGWRVFDNDEVSKMFRIIELSMSDEEIISEYDKEAIAVMTEKGYVRTEKGRPVVLVPVLKSALTNEFGLKALGTQLKELDARMEELIAPCLEFNKKLKKLIPDYLDENERNYQLANHNGYSSQNIMHMLFKKGYLEMPTEEEKKCILTLIQLK